MPRFFEQMELDLQTLGKAVEEGAQTEVANLAHAIKGYCGLMDFQKLAQKAANLEEVAKASEQGDSAKINEAMQSLNAVFASERAKQHL